MILRGEYLAVSLTVDLEPEPVLFLGVKAAAKEQKRVSIQSTRLSLKEAIGLYKTLGSAIRLAKNPPSEVETPAEAGGGKTP